MSERVRRRSARCSVAFPAGAKFPRQLADGSVILCVPRDATHPCCRARRRLRPDVPKPRRPITARSRRTAARRLGGARWHARLRPRGGQSDRAYARGAVGCRRPRAGRPTGRTAYERLTGDNAVHSGRRPSPVRAAPGASSLPASAGRASTRLDVCHEQPHFVCRRDAAGAAGHPGTAYTVQHRRYASRRDAGPRPWSTCGPACGLPPASDVGPGGIASWCEAPPANAPPNAGCMRTFVKVDRAAGTMRDLSLPRAAPTPMPSRRTAAACSGRRRSTVLHIIASTTALPSTKSTSRRSREPHRFPDRCRRVSKSPVGSGMTIRRTSGPRPSWYAASGGRRLMQMCPSFSSA